jgi:hypothetical protein
MRVAAASRVRDRVTDLHLHIEPRVQIQEKCIYSRV